MIGVLYSGLLFQVEIFKLVGGFNFANSHSFIITN